MRKVKTSHKHNIRQTGEKLKHMTNTILGKHVKSKKKLLQHKIRQTWEKLKHLTHTRLGDHEKIFKNLKNTILADKRKVQTSDTH